MINEFKLQGLKLKVVKLEPGSIREQKKRLFYQQALAVKDGTMTGSLYSLCGSFKLSITPGFTYYAIEKTRDVVERSEYSEEEIKILLLFLSVSINSLQIPRHSEFLVRALNDATLTSAFYDEVDYEKLKSRITYLLEHIGDYKWAGLGEMHVEQYNRRRYSIYQLINDLVRDKSDICIDPEIFEYKKISRGVVHEEDKEDIWGTVIKKQGNLERANLGVLYKRPSTGSLIGRCIVRDGAIWTKILIVRVNSPSLIKKFYGAKIVSDTLISKNELILDLTKLPVIGKQYLSRISEESYLSACLNCQIQERAWEMVKKEKKEKAGVKEKREYKLSTSSYYAPSLDSKVSKTMASILVNKYIDDFTPDIRRKELERAKDKKRDMTFRYLLSKRMKFHCIEKVNGVSMSMRLRRIKIYTSD